MKDPLDVLRMKEQDILRVKQEIEALRITAELLGEEPPSATTWPSSDFQRYSSGVAPCA
jgi:hypothetical protein